VQNQAFTELEFSGIFSLAGEFCVFKTGIPGGPESNSDEETSLKYLIHGTTVARSKCIHLTRAALNGI